jgi:CheY-like chemotaxis protein
VAEKILIVDDNQSMRRSLARLLETEAYQVAEAADGEEGLVEYARFLPDLVVMDINMPRMNGLELLNVLKTDPALRTIPVVVLTTSSAEEDILRSYQSHASSYVVKPIDFEQFFSAIQALGRYMLTIVRLPG